MKDRSWLELRLSVKLEPSLHRVLHALNFFSGSAFARIFCHIGRRVWLRRIIFCLVLVGVLVYELRTSTLEAWLLRHYSARLYFALGSGPSPSIVFPQAGPFDERRGYSKVPEFQSRLVQPGGFHVVQQVRMSRGLARLVSLGIAPPYRETAVEGLEIRGADGEALYKAAAADHSFHDFKDIPPVLIRTLLFIENQQLESPSSPRSNPAIQWERLAKAVLLYAGSKLGFSDSIQGGSTLATQMEKFRHSPQGRTQSVWDKLRQLIGASLKVYREGTDTRPRRQEIVIDYLNSVPLSAVPGYGEVTGIGEGLYAWFGLQPEKVWKDLANPALTTAKVKAYKNTLALLVSLPATSSFLVKDHEALNRRVNFYTRRLEKAGIIDEKFADALLKEPIRFMPKARLRSPQSFNQEKASNAVRASMLRLLHVPDLYSLDRLHAEVESTIDSALQGTVTRFFRSLTDPEFVQVRGLNQERMLEGANPRKVIYSLLLFERTPEANVLRVQADNLAEPFDINYGVKLELGSTAKLRTLAHYLEVVALLYREFSSLDDASLAQWVSRGRDPITRWAAGTLIKEKKLSLDEFLDKALERRYSASPYETFFTGKGAHHFANFDPLDNSRILTVRIALQHSTNLVFIRLMRDLVRYHEARLPYDGAAVLFNVNDPKRRAMLVEEAEDETKAILFQAFRRYRGLPEDAIVKRLLGSRQSARAHAILFFALNQGGGEQALTAWLNQNYPVSPDEARRLYRAYSNPRLNLADFGYLLSLHPLSVWCAGELARKPDMRWDELFSRSGAARRISYAWLFNPRNRKAQDLRVRIRIEKDAFARMTPYWQRLGFPFEHLVPTYATAIGNSSDRPSALAELMGIIVNDGVHRATFSLRRLRLASSTPYETVFEPRLTSREQVMEPSVARALKNVLAEVVEVGTASRLKRAFISPDGKTVRVGGKTGSGDNRYKTFDRHGNETSSRAVNRTAAFVFYIGERYYGVITTFVRGREAADYHFTSALPVNVLKLLAPVINARFEKSFSINSGET